MKRVTAEEAVQVVQSGQRVYVHEAMMAPHGLLEALVARAESLENVEVVHLHIDGPAPHLAPGCAGHLRHNAWFVGANARAAVAEGRADATPLILSEIPGLIEDGTLPVDVAMVQLSPPDAHGFCRLGLSVACARAAVDNARVVIAELNPRVPVTLGNSAVHISRIDFAVDVDRPLPEVYVGAPGAVECAIAEHVEKIIPNGATLQIGIGRVPDAVLGQLVNHHDLGIHTEVLGDGLLPLFDRGVITNRKKTRFPGRVITSFARGSRALAEFVDNNPFVEFHPTSVVNSMHEIAQQHQMTAVNSAVEVDITGQVCADSTGERILSGLGGQPDFMRGALAAPGGRAIIALPATARDGSISRISVRLAPGAGVVTMRGSVQWIVTEYGAVNLRGRCLRERAAELISIAHPDHQGELRAAAVARRFFLPPG